MSAMNWSFPRAESLPPYAFVRTDAVKERVVAAGADLIDLGLGNPDRPTPPEIVAELHAAADLGKNHRYHPGRGLLQLRQAASRWYERRYQARFAAEREVIITMGAKEGMSHLCLAILDRGDVAIAPDPCYPIHSGAPMIAGAAVEFYPARADLPAGRAVAQAIERVRARGKNPKLVIANYPQNPTGLVVSREELGELVRVVRDSGAFLLHDLAYADLDFATRHAPSIFDCGLPAEEVKAFGVEVFSMSKSYNMPGWRIGFMAGNERLVAALDHLKTYLDYGTFAPLQYAAAWALDNGDRFASEIRELYQKRATALVAGLRTAGWPGVTEPRGTMFIWAPIPASLGKDSMEAATRLIERAHVGVSPGIGFGAGGDGHVRFALIEDPPRIAQACERIGRLLASKAA
ncbi:MAG TPA: aminotransferase class I/II-fold pyridoxal phosphate-dependent enzyme [Polyangiaceae bacterium]|nr:aminotransferase class I/II-fold pyridoxal phosphate-dependent enzyme [Polyangiaceae bacterium]